MDWGALGRRRRERGKCRRRGDHTGPRRRGSRLAARVVRRSRGQPEPDGNLILQAEQLADDSVDSHAADDRAGLDVDETRRDAQPISNTLVAPTDDVGGVQATTGRQKISGRLRDVLTNGDSGWFAHQVRPDRLGDTGTDPLVVRLAADASERHYRDARDLVRRTIRDGLGLGGHSAAALGDHQEQDGQDDGGRSHEEPERFHCHLKE